MFSHSVAGVYYISVVFSADEEAGLRLLAAVLCVVSAVHQKDVDRSICSQSSGQISLHEHADRQRDGGLWGPKGEKTAETGFIFILKDKIRCIVNQEYIISTYKTVLSTM